MKTLVSAMIFILFAALLGCSKGTSEAQKALEQYIDALKRGDFQTVYELNATVQKKVSLIYRGAEADRESNLKKNFEEYKIMFDSAQPTGDTQGIWLEKFFFPANSQHTVSIIIVEEDKDSVTATFRNRYLAKAEVKVIYPNKDSAPTLGDGKVKEATYFIVLLSGEDVVRGLQKANVVNAWLFKSISVKNGQVEYWLAQ